LVRFSGTLLGPSGACRVLEHGGAVQIGSMFADALGDKPQKPAIPSTLPAFVGEIVRA
jgi:hypothetical protein